MPITSKKLQDELEKKIHQIGLDSEEDAAKKLAVSLGLKYSDLTMLPIDRDALIMISEEEAISGQLVVISKSGNHLIIAVKDPQNEETKRIIETLKDRNFTYNIVITSRQELENVWERYKTFKRTEKKQLGIVSISEEKIEELRNSIENIKDLAEKIKKLNTSEVIDILISGALKIGASDVHLEPEKDGLRVRYRMDGVLSDITDLSLAEYPKILSRIKLVSGLKININNTPQDGRFTIQLHDKNIEVRVSILPGAYGEHVVMRILDPDTISQGIEELGMRGEMLDEIKKQLLKTNGALLTTGPTGSGKTTTLYSFIKFLNKEGVKIITIEDPIEYHIKGISQTQVEKSKGYNFADGLRSIVRQDPDIILVGEIRDKETAEIAIQAGLTGHLVFSTLHTNDAAGTIPRLLDLGANPNNIGPALNVAMAQRLVRKLCTNCKEKKKIVSIDLNEIKTELEKTPKLTKDLSLLNENIEIYYPKEGGCDKCNGLGYKGRVGIFEMFVIDDEIEKLITTSPSIPEVRDFAISKGMITMKQDGYLKVINGSTSIEEVKRVVG